ncbi:hypothetical protein RVM25_36940, partial [Enterobacter hormaechei subsp. xiangfangensis]
AVCLLSFNNPKLSHSGRVHWRQQLPSLRRQACRTSEFVNPRVKARNGYSLCLGLREITVTSMPAYPESGVEIAHRSLFSQYPELRRAGDNRRRWAELAGL